MSRVNMLRKYLSSVCPGTKFFPVSRTNLAGFITHLFAAKYASSTILSKVSAISFSHKIVGLGDPADNFYIKKLLAGVLHQEIVIYVKCHSVIHQLCQQMHTNYNKMINIPCKSSSFIQNDKRTSVLNVTCTS